MAMRSPGPGSGSARLSSSRRSSTGAAHQGSGRPHEGNVTPPDRVKAGQPNGWMRQKKWHRSPVATASNPRGPEERGAVWSSASSKLADRSSGPHPGRWPVEPRRGCQPRSSTDRASRQPDAVAGDILRKSPGCA